MQTEKPFTCFLLLVDFTAVGGRITKVRPRSLRALYNGRERNCLVRTVFRVVARAFNVLLGTGSSSESQRQNEDQGTKHDLVRRR